MCIAFKKKGKTYKPGQSIEVETDEGPLTRPWASYARSERMEYWTRQRYAMPVWIFAESFAERDRLSQELVWETIPEGYAIRAFLAAPKDPEDFLILPDPECYILTRAATAPEVQYFGHDRLPLLEERRS
ncbi:MAG: hypothetical protein AAF571_03715 [Verrucomicrobiota bacterium]